MNSSTEEIWHKSLPLLKTEVGDNVFDLWFSPLRLSQLKDGVAVMDVPNRYYKEWIEDSHPQLLSSVLTSVLNTDVSVRFNISTKEDAAIRKMDAQRRSRKSKLAKKGIYLNPRYTFETFVVGPSNQIARAAAKAITEEPGRLYNPFFIYGGVGLGKTHLMSAIGNRVFDLRPDFNVLYLSAEQFTSEVVSAFRHGKSDELKRKFRTLDMLLIDDVQYVEKKTATQEELFHTLNALYERQKQIVLSSDRPPKEIRSVTDRLRSRFGMGLTADIEPPEFELRVGIIQKKAADNGISAPKEVLELIALKTSTNIRDMEGCLIRLGAHSSLTGNPITMSMAKNVLKDMIHDADRPLTVEGILKSVADYFGLKPQDLKAKKRTKEIAQPRQIAMYLARELTESSLNDIGKNIGGKDHATVIYAYKQIEARRAKDESFDRMIENLKNNLKQ